MAYHVELRHSAAQAVLGIEVRTTVAGIPAALQEAFPAACSPATTNKAQFFRRSRTSNGGQNVPVATCFTIRRCYRSVPGGK